MKRLRFWILLSTIVIPIPVVRVSCSKQAVAEEQPYVPPKAARIVSLEAGPACPIVDEPADPHPKRKHDRCQEQTDLLYMLGGGIFGFIFSSMLREKRS